MAKVTVLFGSASCRASHSRSRFPKHRTGHQRRQRLDEAFDQDVRERALRDEPIDAEWVIEARRAYGAALAVYAHAQAMDEHSALERRRTLAAIEAALERVRWLQSIQLRLDFTSELREERP